MSIEKITPNEIDNFLDSQNEQVEFLSALNFIKRLSSGFEDEILSRVNAQKKYVKIDENTIGELNLNLEHIEIQEKAKPEEVEVNMPTENGKFSIYKNNFELDNTDDEIKNFGFKKKANSENQNGDKPKFQLSNDYSDFFDDDETLTDDDLDNLTEATPEDESTEGNESIENTKDADDNATKNKFTSDTESYTKNNDIRDTESFTENTDIADEFYSPVHNERKKIYNESAGFGVITTKKTNPVDEDEFTSKQNTKRTQSYNEGAEQNIVTTKKINQTNTPVDEFNIYHKSVNYPKTSSDVVDADDTPFGEGEEKVVSTLIKRPEQNAPDELLTKKKPIAEDINFNDLKDFGGIKSKDRLTTACIKRRVVLLTGLGTLESAKWQKLANSSEKTLKQFRELPTFTEFKKVQFAIGETDASKIISEYQTIVAKFISGGNDILNLSEDELKMELEKYKNSIKNNN